MKYLLVVLLLSLFGSALISAKARRFIDSDKQHDDYRKFSRRDNDNDNSNDDDDDDNDDDDYDDNDQTEKAFECMTDMMYCYKQYFIEADNISDAAADLRQLGVRAACKQFTDFAECLTAASLKDHCDNLPDDFARIIRIGHEYINFVCVDKINDIEEHWQCLVNPTVDQELDQCGERIESDLEQCKTDSFVDCARRAFAKTPNCDDGALQLVKQLVKKALNFLPHCSSGHQQLKRMIWHMIKRK